MLNIDQLVIVAYLSSGGILCRSCGEEQNLPTSEAVCAYSAGDFAGSEGLYCDDCEKEIVAPYKWTCPCCGTEYYGEEASDAEDIHYRSKEGKCSVECPGDVDE